MEHLWKVWEQIEPRVRHEKIMLFLDYDGTLTPIVSEPRLARLSPMRRQVLKKLAAADDIEVAVISGRGLKELKSFIRVKGIAYVGNHGFEIEAPDLRLVHPQALGVAKLIKKIAGELRRELKTFPGILVEDKTYTLSVHFRKLKEEKIEKARAVFLKVFHAQGAQFVMTEGKKVWEIRPASQWNKGTTLLWLLARWMAHFQKASLFPFYAGDDQTDEDAFKAVRGKGIGIKITTDGTEPGQAGYFLRSPDEVFDFLKTILKTKQKERNEHVHAAA